MSVIAFFAVMGFAIGLQYGLDQQGVGNPSSPYFDKTIKNFHPEPPLFTAVSTALALGLFAAAICSIISLTLPTRVVVDYPEHIEVNNHDKEVTFRVYPDDPNILYYHVFGDSKIRKIDKRYAKMFFGEDTHYVQTYSLEYTEGWMYYVWPWPHGITPNPEIHIEGKTLNIIDYP